MTAQRQFTAEEIDVMPAGREMDTLVAELIPIEGVKIETGPFIHGPMWKYNGGYRSEFRPSTDIAADYCVFLIACEWRKTNDIAYCRFWDEFERTLNGRDNLPGIPMAWPMKLRLYQIGDYSRAALKVVID